MSPSSSASPSPSAGSRTRHPATPQERHTSSLPQVSPQQTVKQRSKSAVQQSKMAAIASNEPVGRRSEDEPLLGAVGDASQPQGKALSANLVIGTAVIAQAGIWILTGVIWGTMLTNDIALFTAHPLLNSVGLLLMVQAILILQPTHTAAQKKSGTYAHATLQDFAALTLYAGLAVIVYNKLSHDGTHFESPHAIMGLVVYIWIALQASLGFFAFFTPRLLGGEVNAKKTYKYHRASGYVLLVLMFVTVALATQTPYNLNTLDIKLWAVIVASLITLAGIVPRIRKSKFGF